MTTGRDTAIYFAKQAFAHMGMTGNGRALIRLDTPDGARFAYQHDDSGFVIVLKHAADYRERGGAVDAKRTKQATAAASALVRLERNRAELAAMPAAPEVTAALVELAAVAADLVTQCREAGLGFLADQADALEQAARHALPLADMPRPDLESLLKAKEAAAASFGCTYAADAAELIRAELARRAPAAPARVEISASPAFEAPRRAAVVIDATPTWRGILPALLAVVENGSFEGRKIALQELNRMADAADSAVAHDKASREGVAA